jgi:hypothetical protein
MGSTSSSSNPNAKLKNNNSNLAMLIPVIYGAVFSYSMYILSQIFVHHFTVPIPKPNPSNPEVAQELALISSRDFVKMVISYCLITIYMIEDIGSIIKLEFDYPYKSTSRYTYEFVIASLYIITFSLVGTNSKWCILSFALILLVGGRWFAKFIQEYKNDNSEDAKKVCMYAVAQKTWHYVGGLILLLFYLIFFLFNYQNTKYIAGNAYFLIVIFALTTLAWLFFSSLYIAINNRECVLKYNVNVIVPTKLINK